MKQNLKKLLVLVMALMLVLGTLSMSACTDKEQEEKINSLTKDVETLENENTALKKDVETLEKRAAFLENAYAGKLDQNYLRDNNLCTVVVAGDTEKAYLLDLTGLNTDDGLFSVLDALQKANKFEVVAEDSDYGKYLTKVGDVEQNSAEGKYIFILTSVETDFDTSEYASQDTFGGVKLVSSKVGASSMKIEAGAVYYIFTIQYS